MAATAADSPSVVRTSPSDPITSNTPSLVSFQQVPANTGTATSIKDVILQVRCHSEPIAAVRFGMRHHATVINQPLSRSMAQNFWKFLFSEVSSHLHGSCPRCHHWHDHVQYQFNPGKHNKIMCQNEDCQHVIFGLGGNESHESLMSQMTQRESDGDDQRRKPCSNGCQGHVHPTLTISRSSTSRLAPVREKEPNHSPIDRSEPLCLQPTSTSGQNENEKPAPAVCTDAPSTRSEVVNALPTEMPVHQSSDRHEDGQNRFAAFKRRFKRWKSKIPIEFTSPVRRRNRQILQIANLLDIPQQMSDARVLDDKTKTSDMHLMVKPITVDILPKVPVNLDPGDRNLKASYNTTLNGTPSQSRPGSTAERVEDVRANTHETSVEDNKEERRANIRQAKTIEAAQKLCKCTNDCHCLQVQSDDPSPPSSTQRPFSDLASNASEFPEDQYQYLTEANGFRSALPLRRGQGGLLLRHMGPAPAQHEPTDSLIDMSSESSESHRGPHGASEGHMNSRYSSLSQLHRQTRENGPDDAHRDLTEPTTANMDDHPDDEPPALSDSSTTNVHSQRSDTPSELDTNNVDLDDAGMTDGIQTPPELVADVDGDVTPTPTPAPRSTLEDDGMI